MQHLTLEEIARLVDEPGTPSEAAHVASCLVCRRELEEMRGQTSLLGALADPEPAPDAWFALEKALREEGLIRDVPARPAARFAGRRWIRIAAGVALFVAGGAAGMYLRSRPGAQVASAPELLRGNPVVVHGPAGGGAQFVSAEPAPDVDMGGPMVVEPVASASGVRLASSGATGVTRTPQVRRPARTAEAALAERELVNAEAGYVAALQRYAAIADPQNGADDATRMAALDRMINSTRAALESAPDDPVINGYHLAALREREALRQQMAGADKDWF